MTNLELPSTEIKTIATSAWPTVPTWRYVGDRVAADVAYSARFGTSDVPEPMITPGGALAYPLPATEPQR